MKLTPGDVQLLIGSFLLALMNKIPFRYSDTLWRFHQAIQSSTQLRHVTPLNSLQFRCSFQTGFPSTCYVWFPQPSHLDWQGAWGSYDDPTVKRSTFDGGFVTKPAPWGLNHPTGDAPMDSQDLIVILGGWISHIWSYWYIWGWVNTYWLSQSHK